MKNSGTPLRIVKIDSYYNYSYLPSGNFPELSPDEIELFMHLKENQLLNPGVKLTSSCQSDINFMDAYILSGKIDDSIKTCQDRLCYFKNPFNQTGIFLGVFDGHGQGGEYYSDATMNLLFTYISKFIQNLCDFTNLKINWENSETIENIKKSIVFGFRHTNQDLDYEKDQFGSGGSTGTVVIIFDVDNKLKIFTAGVGDSKAILGYLDQIYDIFDDNDHDPCTEKRKRLSGQYIAPCPHENWNKPFLNCGEIAINMTRSFGDFHSVPCGLICYPHIQFLELDKSEISSQINKSCIIMASDGIWEKTDDGNDTITSQEAYKTFKDLGGDCTATCNTLIQKANLNWNEKINPGVNYRDDISIIVLNLSKYIGVYFGVGNIVEFRFSYNQQSYNGIITKILDPNNVGINFCYDSQLSYYDLPNDQITGVNYLPDDLNNPNVKVGDIVWLGNFGTDKLYNEFNNCFGLVVKDISLSIKHVLVKSNTESIPKIYQFQVGTMWTVGSYNQIPIYENQLIKAQLKDRYNDRTIEDIFGISVINQNGSYLLFYRSRSKPSTIFVLPYDQTKVFNEHIISEELKLTNIEIKKIDINDFKSDENNTFTIGEIVRYNDTLNMVKKIDQFGFWVDLYDLNNILDKENYICLGNKPFFSSGKLTEIKKNPNIMRGGIRRESYNYLNRTNSQRVKISKILKGNIL